MSEHLHTDNRTELACYTDHERSEDSIRPINNQKDMFPTVLHNFRQSSLA